MEDKKAIDRTITMEWIDANANPEIVAEDVAQGYHTYGKLQSKASGFKRIIYNELYPGIDVIYSFNENTKVGFEYSVVVKTGADINMVQMKYGGGVKK